MCVHILIDIINILYLFNLLIHTPIHAESIIHVFVSFSHVITSNKRRLIDSNCYVLVILFSKIAQIFTNLIAHVSLFMSVSHYIST